MQRETNDGHRGEHDWQLARIEHCYPDGAWAEVEGTTSSPLAIGTMGLFYCRWCLIWTTMNIPKDLPGFGGSSARAFG